MSISRNAILLSLGAVLMAAFMFIDACTPAETSDTLNALDAALSTLVQNRSLAEQFVRDVKTNVDATDPTYPQVMEDYEAARDAYNHCLDLVELAAKTNDSHPAIARAVEESQNATGDFLTRATRSLRPSVDTRGIAFRRAVVIPEDLPQNLNRLSKRYRTQMIRQFDDQVRWRSWRQL